MIDPKQSRNIRDAIHASIAESESTEEATSAVMGVLSHMRVAVFDQTDSLPLLSSTGRVLAMIIEYPEITISDMAIRIGVGESSVQRSVSNLVRRGLVKRTRVLRQNHYEVNRDTLLEHPDVRRFAMAVLGIVEGEA